MHVDWSIRALQAGKHVLSEKPLSRRPEDVERAFDAADACGPPARRGVHVAPPPAGRGGVRELVASGAIGELRTIRAAFAFRGDDPSDVRFQAGLDGGGLMDVGCYCISGCRTLAGADPERGYLEMLEGGDGVDVAAGALLRFPGDVFAHFDCGLAYPGGAYLSAVGTDGVVFLGDPWHAKDPVIELRRDGETERIEVGRGRLLRARARRLRRRGGGERAPLLGRADALGQARTIAALYQSAEKGTPCPIT